MRHWCLFSWTVAILGSVVLVFSGFSDVSFEDIETAILKEDYQQAKSIAAQWLSAPSQAHSLEEVRYYLALCDVRLGYLSEAREVFEQLLEKDVTRTLRDKALLGLFDVYYMDGNYEKALSISKKLLTLRPRSEFLSLVYLKHARANLKLAHWGKAKAYLKKLARYFPDSLEGRVARQLLNEKQYFAVQVGAFINQTKAESLATELQRQGEYAYIVETVDSDGNKFFRVRVGQLGRLREAQTLKVKLSTAGYPTQIYP